MINTKDPPVPLAAATFADCRDLESTKDGESVKMGRVWIDSVSIKSTRCPVRSQVKRGGAGGEHWGIPGTCSWRRDAARSNHARCARTVIWRNLKVVNRPCRSSTTACPPNLKCQVRDCSHKHGVYHWGWLGLEPHESKKDTRTTARTRALNGGFDGVTGGVAELETGLPSRPCWKGYIPLGFPFINFFLFFSSCSTHKAASVS